MHAAFEAARFQAATPLRISRSCGSRATPVWISSAVQPQAGQPVRLEIVCETAGMVPQLVAVADPSGVPVYSGSGFNGLPAKRGAALRAAADGHRAVRVFVVSDGDQSGVHLLSALAEEILTSGAASN
ncbi:hypothetical protein AB0M39_15580 [Streptomyces sp. NPDC051907]|uniref:hypothetical protein n=1 Tax=Streptomyces sp. NPDC051907 TaxID=3155284 RepID=UPI00342856DC